MVTHSHRHRRHRGARPHCVGTVVHIMALVLVAVVHIVALILVMVTVVLVASSCMFVVVAVELVGWAVEAVVMTWQHHCVEKVSLNSETTQKKTHQHEAVPAWFAMPV